MEFNEQNPSPAHDESFYSITASADMSWYHYWPSHPGSSALYHSQINGQVPGHWTHYIDHSQSGSHSSPPPTQHPSQVWEAPGQGRADYQYVGGDSVCPSSQIPSGVVLQIPNDRSSHYDEPSSTLWYPSSAPSALTVTPSRRPSHHSDPGLPTTFQDNSGLQSHSNLRPDTGSDVVATSQTNPQGTKQEKSPSDTEPSLSAGPSPGSGHVVRPTIRCWDHDCGGRKFSSISNFRRHQRERAGQTTVCFCPRCGAAFYRRWTRDHHVERGSCLRIPRWSSGASQLRPWSRQEETP